MENIGDVRGYLRTFANSNNVIIKENVFFKLEDMLQSSADVCLLEYKAFLENEEKLNTWREQYDMKFIFSTSDIKDIIEIVQVHPEQYLLLSPIEQDSLSKVFENIKAKIKRNAVVVKLAHAEDRRIKLQDLNYIDIVGRNIRYHLSDGREFDGQTLRQSFSKEIEYLLIKPELYFIQPSLIINLTNIETLFADHAKFDNGDVVYFPKAAYERLKETWKNYII